MSVNSCLNNICLVSELLFNLEDELVDSIAEDIPSEVREKCPTIQVEYDDGKVEIVVYVLTSDVEEVYTCLHSIYQDLPWTIEYGCNFSNIVLDLTDYNVVYNQLYDEY